MTDMYRVNLIPAARQDARRRRRHMRVCMTASSIYLLLATLGATVFYVARNPGSPVVEKTLVTADDQLRHLTTDCTAARADLTATKAALTVNRQIASQPDWSRLLLLLAAQTGDSIMLKSCALGGKAEPAPVPISSSVTLASAAKSTSSRPPR